MKTRSWFNRPKSGWMTFCGSLNAIGALRWLPIQLESSMCVVKSSGWVSVSTEKKENSFQLGRSSLLEINAITLVTWSGWDIHLWLTVHCPEIQLVHSFLGF